MWHINQLQVSHGWEPTFWSDCFSSALSWDETLAEIGDNCLTNINVSVPQKPHSGAGSTFFCTMRRLVLWTSWAPEIGRKPGGFSCFNSYSWILTTFFFLSPHKFRCGHSTYRKNCRQNIQLLSNNIEINRSTSQVEAMTINRCGLCRWRNHMLCFSVAICINRCNLLRWRGLAGPFDMRLSAFTWSTTKRLWLTSAKGKQKWGRLRLILFRSQLKL